MVSGTFYPDDQDELLETIHSCFTNSIGPGRFPQRDNGGSKTDRVECVLVPHAGFKYSGPIAAHSYQLAHDFFISNEGKKCTAIILGPNHYGIGSGLSISPHRYWSTPLGILEVDNTTAKKMTQNSSSLDMDDIAHSKEHSIEVQLPFLQAVLPSDIRARFIPISIMLQDIDTSMELAERIVRVMQDSNQSFLVVGSSDLTHYESQNQASFKDRKVLEAVHNLDVTSFSNAIERFGVTACGYGPIATVMQISKLLGRRRGEVLRYATSGDITGEKSSVVGYSAVHFV